MKKPWRLFFEKRRFTGRTRRPREWVGVHAAALAREAPMRAALAAAIRAAQDAVDLGPVRISLERLDAGSAVAAFPWAAFENALYLGVRPALADAMRAAAVPAARALGEQLGIGVHVVKQLDSELLATFTMRNARADTFLAQHGAELVRQLGMESRVALREIVLEAYRSGVDVRGQAARIAEVLRQSVGLNARQARALARFEAALAEEVAPGRRAGLVAAQRDRLIMQRSKVIARTETMIAAGRGQQEVWLQARDDGLLDERRTMRRWLAQPGLNANNPCPICEGLHDQVRGLDQSFVSDYDGTTVLAPPAHPQCLCTTVLDIQEP